VPKAIIIDAPDVLTDEQENDRAAVAAIRKVVAEAGVRVSEQALKEADTFSIESFAPSRYQAMIFKLVGRDAVLGLRCVNAFRREFKPQVRVRQEARELLRLCHSQRWKVALADTPTQEEASVLQQLGLRKAFHLLGPPAKLRIALPDVRVLEFLTGALSVDPRQCVMLGSRIDNNVRPANTLRMTPVLLRMGVHGTRQLPRDLRDVPDFEATSVQDLMQILPTIREEVAV
jgi:putative hydrolase of the HAD superfamily